jgi:hypothetical protein
MQLQLQDKDGNPLAMLIGDDRPLNSFNIAHDCIYVHVCIIYYIIILLLCVD